MDDPSRPSLAEYRRNPGGAAATAWWKTRAPAPPNITVTQAMATMPYPAGARRYFKLVHGLDSVEMPTWPAGVTCAAGLDPRWDGEIAALISVAYDQAMDVDPATVTRWRGMPVHSPALWLGAIDAAGELVGCLLTDLDTAVPEASLEWLQVHPDLRGRGIGRALVLEALTRAQGLADFAVVAGEVDNPTSPEKVYRACGFVGDDVWDVTRLDA